MSIYVCKLAKYYGLLAINDIISLDSSVNLTFITVTNEPRTYYEVQYSFYSSEWEHAIEAKYTQLLKVGVFEWVNELLASKKAIESCIIFKKKLNEHGNHVKFKAHIVAKDFSQISGKDFSETFFSVAKFTTLWMFFTLAAYLDFEIYQIDIIVAYL